VFFRRQLRRHEGKELLHSSVKDFFTSHNIVSRRMHLAAGVRGCWREGLLA
jgi:hypothetical protein